MTQAQPMPPTYRELAQLLIRLHWVLTRDPKSPGNLARIERSFVALNDMLDRIAIAQVAGTLECWPELRLEEL